MIVINGNISNLSTVTQGYSPEDLEKKLAQILYASDQVYEYASLEQLRFELSLRKNIVKAARELDNTYFRFRVFDKSICNPLFWQRTDEGGFLLKDNVRPSDAIMDIYENSSKYGTECSTAIIIVYYKALLSLYPEELFNSTFSNIQLMNWHYLDDELDIHKYRSAPDYLPGDCRYFVNPEVNPERPEWQGENTIYLGDDLYYGHGFGIGTAEEVIRALNKRRKPDATISASLKESVIRPNFRRLANILLNYHSGRLQQYYSEELEKNNYFYL